MVVNALGPSCPSCGAWITKVTLTKLSSECDYVVRRRHCEFCDHRFYSRQQREEVVDIKWKTDARGKSTIPKVIKVYDTPYRGRSA